MRILTVTNMYPTEQSPQFGIFVQEQVNSVKALGHDVDVFFINGREGRLRHKAYALGFPRLWKVLAEQKYDVIHAHYVFSGIVARAQRSAPLVLTHHGPELLDPWQGPVCRWTRRWADRTIVVAPWMVPVLGLDDVDVIPCGVDLSLFEPIERGQARAELGLDPEKRYVLFAGNSWDKRKRYEVVQAAVEIARAKAPDIELLTVCGQPHDRVPYYMFGADVLAMASTSEGSAQVVKEAMACNLPVVATDAGDNWDVIRGTDGCFETTADPADMAAKLLAAVSPPRRTDGRARVDRFGLDAIAQQVVSVYEKVISEQTRTARSVTPAREGVA
jgi:glycosyltransferase involved in cell wall biosynthesis